MSNVTPVDLEKRIRVIYDHLYANHSKRTPESISFEMGKVLHLAQYAEEVLSETPAFDFSSTELKRLSKGDRSLTDPLFTKCILYFEKMNIEWDIYPKNTAIELSRDDLAFVVAQLSGVLVSDRKKDIFGDAIEIFRDIWAKRQGGMFFTDSRVTHLAMSLLNFDPRNGDDLIDISSGTGGFLLAGINHIRELLENDNAKDVEAQVIKYAKNSIKGQEIDEDVARIANASISSRLGTFGHTFVHQGDSISPNSFGIDSQVAHEGKHLCLATNPPFGTKTTIKSEEVLNYYEVSRISAKADNRRSNSVIPKPPDILLLERNLRLLVPGKGRLAIVLPYQILSGPQTRNVREWLIRRAQIEAVIDLPVETFQPHTGTKTSLVILKRREIPLNSLMQLEGSTHKIFMANPEHIGHDRRGNPVIARNPDGSLSGEIWTDFPDVERAFISFCKGKDPSAENENAFFIAEDKILADPEIRFNALFHRQEGNDSSSGLPKGWKTKKINDLVLKVFYPGRFKREYINKRNGAIPFFGGSNIAEIIMETEKWLSPDYSKIDQLLVKKGWILITRSGSTGIVSSVPEPWDGFAFSEHVIRIIPDPKKMPMEYLLAFLKSNYAQQILARGVFGSVIDEINPNFILDMDVPIPDDIKLMESIVKKVRSAEDAREVTLSNLYGAVQDLDGFFSGKSLKK